MKNKLLFIYQMFNLNKFLNNIFSDFYLVYNVV